MFQNKFLLAIVVALLPLSVSAQIGAPVGIFTPVRGGVQGGGLTNGYTFNSLQFSLSGTNVTIISGFRSTNAFMITPRLSSPLVTNITEYGTSDIVAAQTNRSTLGVAGATTLTSTLAVTGAQTNQGALGVAGATLIDDTLEIVGNQTNRNSIAVAGSVAIDSDLTVSGTTVQFDAETTINSSATVGGDLRVTDTIQVGDRAWAKNFQSTNSITLDGLTASRIAGLNGSKTVTNTSVTIDLFQNFFAMGITTIVAGANVTIATNNGALEITGSAGGTAGGDSGAIQFNQGDAFAGTNEFVYDRTNGRVSLNLSGVRPNRGIELGGSTTQAAILLGAGTATNEVYYSGMRTISDQDLELGTQAGYTWRIDNTDGSFRMNTPTGNIGKPSAEVKIMHSLVNSNRSLALIGSASSTGTLYGTNMNWTVNLTSNMTFAVANLLDHVKYNLILSNTTYTITWPALTSLRWSDVANNVSAPALQGGEYTIEIVKNENGTTARVLSGPESPFSVVYGDGDGDTNVTIQATGPDYYVSGATNISIAVMGYVSNVPLYWSLTVTNGGGSDKTIHFSSVTNRWRFAGTYGTNAPNTLTNGTQLLLSGRSDGTNTLLGYQYFAWP